MLRALRKGFWVFLALWCTASSIITLWVILRGGAGHTTIFHEHAQAVPVIVEYKDFVTILLTALGVMIAFGTIAVAALAVFGYAEGRKMVEGIVRSAVREQLQPSLARYQQVIGLARTSSDEGDRIASQADDLQ